MAAVCVSIIPPRRVKVCLPFLTFSSINQCFHGLLGSECRERGASSPRPPDGFIRPNSIHTEVGAVRNSLFHTEKPAPAQKNIFSQIWNISIYDLGCTTYIGNHFQKSNHCWWSGNCFLARRLWLILKLNHWATARRRRPENSKQEYPGCHAGSSVVQLLPTFFNVPNPLLCFPWEADNVDVKMFVGIALNKSTLKCFNCKPADVGYENNARSASWDPCVFPSDLFSLGNFKRFNNNSFSWCSNSWARLHKWIEPIFHSITIYPSDRPAAVRRPTRLLSNPASV